MSDDPMTTQNVKIHRLGSLGEGGLVRLGQRCVALSGAAARPAMSEMPLGQGSFLVQRRGKQSAGGNPRSEARQR